MLITEFLIARIHDDEEDAKRIAAERSDPDLRVEFEDTTLSAADIQERWKTRNTRLHPTATWLVGMAPARILAECAAKRAVIAECLPYVTRGTVEYASDDALGDRVLAALALPYADHPDFPLQDQATRA